MKKKLFALLFSVMLCASVQLPAAAEETAETDWTDLTLFSIASDEQGEITVQSAGSDRIIAPGTGGTRTVEVRNPYAQTADCRICAEAVLHTENGDPLKKIPFCVWIADEDSERKQLPVLSEAEADAFSDEEILHSKLQADGMTAVTVSWEWPFESGDDIYDTELGNRGTETLTVRLKTVITADEPGAGADKEGEKAPSGEPGRDRSQPVILGAEAADPVWFMCIGTAALTVLMIIVWCMAKKGKEAE